MRKWTVIGLSLLTLLGSSTQAAKVVLDNVPHYRWWNGCSPTAAGALIAYWDSQPGFENLYKPGDAQIWCGDATQGTRRMVASQRHLEGDDSPPDSIASFMGTNSEGGTRWADVTSGLEAFIEWDDTSAYDMKDGYTAITDTLDHLESSFETVKAEIDAGRPALLSMLTNDGAHSVVAYGYDDDLTFDLYDNGKVEFVTVPSFAVMDTWAPGSGGGSRWYSWEKNGDEWEQVIVEEVFDDQGHEWWPYFEANHFYSGEDEWQVFSIHTIEIVPEPATIVLVGLGGLILARRHKKRD